MKPRAQFFSYLHCASHSIWGAHSRARGSNISLPALFITRTPIPSMAVSPIILSSMLCAAACGYHPNRVPRHARCSCLYLINVLFESVSNLSLMGMTTYYQVRSF